MSNITIIFKRTAFLFIAASVALSSCGGGKDITAEEAAVNLMGHYEPDAVLAMEPGQLIEKSGIAEDGMIPGEMKFMFGEQLDYVLDEEKSGLGFDGKSFVFMKFGDKDLEWMVMIFNISNKENFEKMIKEEMEVEPKETDGFMSVYKKGTAVGWYDTFGISVTMMSRKKKDEAEPMLAEMMKKATEEAESIKPEYNDLINDKSDFTALYDVHSIMPMVIRESHGDEKKMMEAMMEWTKETYVLYTLNFEVDKIVAKMKNTYSAKSKKEFDEMGKKGIDDSFMTTLTDSSLIGFFTFAANPEPVYDFIGKIGGEEFENTEFEFKNKMGVDLLNIVKTFTGDVSFSMIDVEKKSFTETYINENGQEESYSYDRENPVIAVVIGVKDNTWQQIVDTVSDIEKRENYYVMDRGNGYLAFSNSKIFISTSEKLAKQFATTGKLNNWSADGIEKKATQHTAFGYFDFKTLMNVIPEKEKATVEAVFSNADYAVAYGNANETTVEMHFKKTGKNSLYNLTSAVMEMMSLDNMLDF